MQTTGVCSPAVARRQVVKQKVDMHKIVLKVVCNKTVRNILKTKRSKKTRK
jgi:hypothetical protein